MNQKLALGALLAVISSSSTACADPEGWRSETVDLGISADLSAVSRRHSGYLAVGTSGTIVYWDEHAPARADRFVRVTDIGDLDLNALSSSSAGSALAVGDGGIAGFIADDDKSWTPLDLGVSADLHAIVELDDGLMVVGDGVVLQRPFGGEWTELPPPEGGWGELRAGADDGNHVYLVGLDGIVWTKDSGSVEEPWIAGSPGTNADLFDVDASPGGDMIAVGAEGTLLLYSGGWQSVDTGLTVDLIRYQNDLLLTADGELFEVDELDGTIELSSIRSYPGARGVAVDRDGIDHDQDHIAVVGVGGLAIQLEYHTQHPW